MPRGQIDKWYELFNLYLVVNILWQDSSGQEKDLFFRKRDEFCFTCVFGLFKTTSELSKDVPKRPIWKIIVSVAWNGNRIGSQGNYVLIKIASSRPRIWRCCGRGIKSVQVVLNSGPLADVPRRKRVAYQLDTLVDGFYISRTVHT